MTPLEAIADALGLTPDEVAAMTWPELQLRRASLKADLDAAVAERRRTAETN